MKSFHPDCVMLFGDRLLELRFYFIFLCITSEPCLLHKNYVIFIDCNKIPSTCCYSCSIRYINTYKNDGVVDFKPEKILSCQNSYVHMYICFPYEKYEFARLCDVLKLVYNQEKLGILVSWHLIPY